MLYDNLLLLSLLFSFTSFSASIAARPLGEIIAATATPPIAFFASWHMYEVQVRSGEVTSWHMYEVQVRSGEVTSWHMYEVQVRSGEVTSWHMYEVQVRSGEVTSWHMYEVQVRSGEVTSWHMYEVQVRSGEVTSWHMYEVQAHIQKVLYFLPDAFFSKFCGPLASLASLPYYLWPARFARKYLTLDQFTSRDVGRIFLWGAVGERSEPTRPIHLRSKQAVAGVWGRSPQRGPGAEPFGGG